MIFRLEAEPEFEIKFVAYRKCSGLLRSDCERIENAVRLRLEERIKIQNMNGQKPSVKIPIKKLNASSVACAETAAKEFRKKLDLGNDPVASITGMLENYCIHVIEIDANEKFDGISAYASDNKNNIIAAVVTRKNIAGERQRLNLIHEIGHLVLNPGPGVGEEKAAFRFASAFLAHTDMIYKEIGSHRSFITAEELFILKRTFGMSIQAIL